MGEPVKVEPDETNKLREGNYVDFTFLGIKTIKYYLLAT